MTHRQRKTDAPAGTSAHENSPMKLRIFSYLAIFIAVVLIVLWLFQIVFLEDFYRGLTMFSMKKNSDALVSASLDSIENDTYSLAEKFDCCISVYKIENGNGTLAAVAHVRSSCMIHNSLTGDAFLNSVYSATLKDKYYIETIGDVRDDDRPESIICAQSKERGGYTLLAVINGAVAPVSATVQTLTYQLIIISAVLLILAAALAAIISRRLSAPFIKMSQEAARLAEGKYDVNFSGGGYREADELATALNYAAAELGSLDTMQKELIANISHDLRTPLTMIKGYAEVMRDIPGEANEENLQVIIDETERLSSLVSDLLDISRLNGGGTTLNLEKFDLTAEIDAAMERYRHLVERDGYRIVFEHCESVTVRGDKIRLLQVIYNLINNAVNYTGEDKLVTVTQTVTDSVCRISVTDTGDGIPPEQIEKIWDRYYRIKDHHKRSQVGSGLGLSIVRGILELHGGRYGVSSTTGGGSTFWFELNKVE